MSTQILLQNVQKKYAHQPIFIQTVTEFMESVEPYLESVNATEEDYTRLEGLLIPERIITFRVGWTDDTQKMRYNTGYRIQFNSALGPYKGGLRLDPSVNEDILKFLGFEQIFKNALTGLPLGAGKGGSDFNPKGKSDTEIRSFARAFMTELYRHIGIETDVPAGDIGVGAREIGYLYGMYKQIANKNEGVLTGKGITFGGSLGRTEATGYGAIYFAAEMLATRDEKLEGKTAVVSGSGNVALYAARKLVQEGATVKTLSGRGGYVVKETGLSLAEIDHIESEKKERKSLAEITIEGSLYSEGSVWIDVQADMYFPCATQNEINGEQAQAIVNHGAVLVAEGANMPSDLDALHIFKEADLLFGPAKAVNAGGVAVSGLEMAQNASHLPWTAEVVDQKLREIMTQIHATSVQYGTKADGSVDYVDGANIGGFVRVFEAMEALGW
ncbi:MAG: glutamate dehydrogenase (NADP+) [Patiriisocius sp.]|jgi:glutamate dehydrogenase (NADP+)